VNQAKREKIGSIADKIRSVLRVETPVDLEKVIEALGGRIEYLGPSADRPEASIEKDPHRARGFVIRLAGDKVIARQRFSLAHELGHLFLHMGFADIERWRSAPNFVESYNRQGYGEQEYEAHEFAAAFLMPSAEYKQMLAASGSDVSKVAEHFDVSREAALYRGRWLEVINW